MSVELKDYLEELYNALLFLDQENVLYYNLTIHSGRGYGQDVMVRSDFIREMLKGQITDAKVKEKLMGREENAS